LVLLDPPVLLGPLALLAPLVRTVPGDSVVTPAPPDLRESRATSDPPAWLETKDPPERADPPVLLVPPDLKDNSEVRDSLDCLALEATAVCLVVLVPLESLVE